MVKISVLSFFMSEAGEGLDDIVGKTVAFRLQTAPRVLLFQTALSQIKAKLTSTGKVLPGMLITGQRLK